MAVSEYQVRAARKIFSVSGGEKVLAVNAKCGIFEGGGMLVSGRQITAARAMIAIDQPTLATAAGVAVSTIRNLEGFGANPIMARASTVRAVQFALEGLGIEFLNGRRPGVRMRGME